MDQSTKSFVKKGLTLGKICPVYLLVNFLVNCSQGMSLNRSAHLRAIAFKGLGLRNPQSGHSVFIEHGLPGEEFFNRQGVTVARFF